MKAQVKTRWRPLVWAGVALLGFGVAAALATPTFTRSSYDPASAAPQGTRAAAELLRDQGVTVERTTDLDVALSAGRGETLVVAYPWRLPRDVVAELEASPADVVMLSAVSGDRGFHGVVKGTSVTAQDREPGCSLDAAVRAGSARTGGDSLAVPESSTEEVRCYLADGAAPTVVQVETEQGTTVTVTGSAGFMTNEWLDDSGNAALTLNLLGARDRVTWWLPGPSLTGRQSLTSLLPDAVWPVLGALVVVVLLLALWRGRRLGPVVTEPLPVAVQASETTEGRSRIYRRHRTRSLAARHLRDMAVSDAADWLGLPPGADQAATVTAVAAATGRPEPEVSRILYGPPPERDGELVTLGHQLAELAEEVRRT